MPLVDYESSDEGSENDNEEPEKEKGNPKQETQQKPVSDGANLNENLSNSGSVPLFSGLPKPKKNFSFAGDDKKLSKLLLNKNNISLGQRNEGESIKISVPSVSEFDDDDKDQPAAKKLKPSVKGVGLFAILPPPKNVSAKETKRTLVPHILTKSQGKQTVSASTNKRYKSGENTADVKEVPTNEDDDEDTPVGNSFFGSVLTEPNIPEEPKLSSDNENTTNEVIQNEARENLVNSAWEQVTPEDTSNYSIIQNVPEDNYNYPVNTSTAETIPVEDNPLELDEKALQILCGGKKKRQQMPMNIIDLSGEEIMPDSKEWLLKQFTEEKKVKGHSHRKSAGPSTQQRRKHQITYLAFQAKEQELELQNQWANNRMSRKQTQSKYGF